jgi:hypothetical protein
MNENPQASPDASEEDGELTLDVDAFDENETITFKKIEEVNL